MPVEIQFLANVGSMLRDLRKGRAGLQDVGEALDTVRREGVANTSRLEASFTDLATSARRIEPERNLSRPVVKATHDVSQGVEDMRANTASNLKEVAASFDGTAQGISDGVQGLVAELLEGFGPAGLIVGALAAGGLGLISTQLQAGDTQAQAVRDHIGQLTDELIDAGATGQSSMGQVVDRLRQLAVETDTSKDSLGKLEGVAGGNHDTFEQLAQAYAGSGDALNGLWRSTTQHYTALQREREALDLSNASSRTRLDTIDAEQSSLRSVIESLEHARKTYDDAREGERRWLAAGGDALTRKATATQAYADSVQGALADAGTDWQSFADKEGGLSLDRYLRLMRRKAQAVTDYEANVKTASHLLNDDALAYIESLGTDAAPLLDKFIRAPIDKQRELEEIWGTLGRQSGKAFNLDLQRQLNNTPTPAPIEVTVVPVLHKSSLQKVVDALKKPQYVDVVPRAIAKPFGSKNP